jgi:hypothetical protein
MSGYNTTTRTNTYTVIDIRKTFEGFEADLRMIARRTNKWTIAYAEQQMHDVLQFAEGRYVSFIDIILLDGNQVALRAVRYTVNSEGKAISSQRPGSNDWTDIPDTTVSLLVTYNSDWGALTPEQQAKFKSDSNFKLTWGNSQIDNSFRHLSKESAQLYGSNGYEVQKTNFK